MTKTVEQAYAELSAAFRKNGHMVDWADNGVIVQASTYWRDSTRFGNGTTRFGALCSLSSKVATLENRSLESLAAKLQEELHGEAGEPVKPEPVKPVAHFNHDLADALFQRLYCLDRESGKVVDADALAQEAIDAAMAQWRAIQERTGQ